MTDKPGNTEHLKPNWDVGLKQNEPVGWALFLIGLAVLASYVIMSGFTPADPETGSSFGKTLLNLAHMWLGPVLIVCGAILSDQVNRIIPFHGLRSGMYVTTLNLFRNLDPREKEKFCLQYPNDPNRIIPFVGKNGGVRRNTYLDAPDSRFRGKHVQYTNPETGELFCIICSQCAKICPNDIITIESEMEEVEVDGKTKKKRKLTKFEVDLSKCFFCGLCQDVCPEPALKLDGGYEFGEYQRSKMVANLDNMVRELPREQYEAYKAEKEEEKRQKELAKKQKAEEAAKKKAAEEAAAKEEKSHLGDKPAGNDTCETGGEG